LFKKNTKNALAWERRKRVVPQYTSDEVVLFLKALDLNYLFGLYQLKVKK